MQSIQYRINALKEFKLCSDEQIEDLNKIIILFEEEYNILMEEENAGAMITHISAAFNRINTGDIIDALDDLILDDLKTSLLYDKSLEIFYNIKEKISTAIPDNEKGYFILHICNLINQDKI